MAVNFKTFDNYIREIIFHPERSKKWMSDRRLSTSEKKILQGHLYVRDNKYDLAIQEVESIRSMELEFITNQKHLLLGICYNNIGSYNRSYQFLKLAAKGFQSESQNYHLFTTLFNLINNLGNLCKIDEMSSVINKMTSLRVSGKLPEIRLLRAQFIFACDSNNREMAESLLPEIHKLKSDMPESELGPQLICEFLYHIKQSRLDLAENVLNQMRRYRKFMVSENFHFIKKLLAALKEDRTIYVYERDFPSPESVLFRQIKVIESLQAQNNQEANKHWLYLQNTYGKELYQDEFMWMGEKCLFSLCLDKYKSKTESRKEVNRVDFISGDRPKYLIAYDYLKESNKAVRSEELYELLYDEVPTDKEDFKKLVLILSKIRKELGVKIISRKGTYQLFTSNHDKIKREA